VTLGQAVAQHFHWTSWERLITKNGLIIDRPYLASHPVWPEIVYPIDYGYICNTTSSDGEGVDVFVGTARLGLVGLIMTRDHRKGDREIKLLYNCTPQEIYMVQGFINFDRTRMEGALILRQRMYALWERMGVLTRTTGSFSA